MLCWFDEDAALLAALRHHRGAMDAADAWVQAQPRLSGYCSVCRAATAFVVDTGVRFGPDINLREGLQCPGCGLGNRNRLVYTAVCERAFPESARGLMLEATTVLYDRLAQALPWLEGSEFFGPGHAPGTRHAVRGRSVVHQSITELGYRDGSLDLVVHNDVLEHVADTDRALSECRRVLRPGGACVFTMPFFPLRATTLVRGRHAADGSLVHLEPPEYHGDGLRSEGIYTYYHFGLDLLGRVAAAGFRTVEVGIDFDVFRGHTANNYRYGDEAWMPPVVLRALA
ncbi:MAG TPA: class I SAM-dependent methyltransferase [Arenimonas sp.]|uniref:class I SAM-dependent methyltransferase n=1 Tax=Arenimonas sp. TaxID=1872635 RepID=UPI002D806364|nr:class I SAM-dependent methyltransferase [Arenimonas sp.]HEU0151719.1 class I SAM-dependent methyltransferase [Arenimonas sp.]